MARTRLTLRLVVGMLMVTLGSTAERSFSTRWAVFCHWADHPSASAARTTASPASVNLDSSFLSKERFLRVLMDLDLPWWWWFSKSRYNKL